VQIQDERKGKLDEFPFRSIIIGTEFHFFQKQLVVPAHDFRLLRE